MILCDLMMSETDGIAIYDALKEKNPHLLNRIVFVTGGAFTHRAKEFVSSVDIILLEKPMPLEQVRKVVELVCAGQRKS